MALSSPRGSARRPAFRLFLRGRAWLSEESHTGEVHQAREAPTDPTACVMARPLAEPRPARKAEHLENPQASCTATTPPIALIALVT